MRSKVVYTWIPRIKQPSEVYKLTCYPKIVSSFPTDTRNVLLAFGSFILLFCFVSFCLAFVFDSLWCWESNPTQHGGCQRPMDIVILEECSFMHSRQMLYH